METSTRSQQVLSLPDDDDDERRARAAEHFSLSPPKTLSRVTHCTSNVLLLKLVVQGTIIEHEVNEQEVFLRVILHNVRLNF